MINSYLNIFFARYPRKSIRLLEIIPPLIAVFLMGADYHRQAEYNTLHCLETSEECSVEKKDSISRNLCIVLICLILLSGMGFLISKIPDKAVATEQEQTAAVRDAVDVVSKIVYVEDKKASICYAYPWGGTADGCPSLAAVPCEKVKDLLKN